MKRPSNPHFTELPFLIVALALSFQALLKRLQKEAGLKQDVAIGMGSIYFALCENEGCVMKELAGMLAMPKGTLSGLIARMEQMGLVERWRCPADGRAQRVKLSRKARVLEPNLRERHSQAMAILQAGLGDREVSQLTSLLQRVLANLRESESEARVERNASRSAPASRSSEASRAGRTRSNATSTATP